MQSNLAFYETRVIGALLEKEITTPDQYPLSLNALTNACNQKSNRDPVLNLDEATVQQTLDGLIKRHLVSEKTGFGSRVTKYQHRFCNTAFGALRLSAQELAIIAELLLRGPQTPGELRTRAERLGKFNDVQEVEAALRSLIERGDGPFVVKLAREAGRRESRYAHLLSGEVQAAESAAGPDIESSLTRSDHDRLSELEQQIAALQQELSEIRSLLEQRT
ncbi:MAG: YceH family protein [Gammaproteobacteria bacterium]